MYSFRTAATRIAAAILTAAALTGCSAQGGETEKSSETTYTTTASESTPATTSEATAESTAESKTDIIAADPILSEESCTTEEKPLETNDATKPADDPANVEAQKDLVEQQEKEQEEAEQNPYGDEYSDLTDDQYKEIGITPPGQEDSSTPATNSEGKTIAEIRDEAINKSDEKIKNGEQGFNEENLKDGREAAIKRAQELGWSQEEIEAAFGKQ